MMPGIVASPTPTVGISGDSMSWTEHVGPSFLASALAAIQPAVPPPTTAIRLMRRSVCIEFSCTVAECGTGGLSTARVTLRIPQKLPRMPRSMRRDPDSNANGRFSNCRY